MSVSWNAAGGTDVGRVRSRNEDTFRIDETLGIFLVADGMGGHAAGEIASALAADATLEVLSRRAVDGESRPADLLREAFTEAHRRIVACCAADPRTAGMGTTLTAAVIEPSGLLHVGHIGDSRLYRLRGTQLDQLTHDHTWVQREVDAGRLERAATRSHPLAHILTRVLVAADPPDPELIEDRVRPGDLLILCSDGLYNMLEGSELLALLDSERRPEEIARALVDAANQAGGTDNVTVVAVWIEEGG